MLFNIMWGNVFYYYYLLHKNVGIKKVSAFYLDLWKKSYSID